MLKFGNTYLNFGGTYLKGWKANTNPLNLPPNTIRLKYKNDVTPTFSYGGTATQVTQAPNVWDLTYDRKDWTRLLQEQGDLLEILGGNTSNVIDMSYLCQSCSSLTTVALFDTSNVKDYMGSMFSRCTSLTSVPLFDMTKVTYIADMFYNCTSLTSVPFFNTSNITNMESMFEGCTSLTGIPNFDTSNVDNMERLFNNCNSLVSVPLLDTSKTTYLAYMFQNCSSLSSLPLFDFSNVTNMNWMFKNCYSLTSIPLFDTSKVTNMYQTFEGCYNVQSGALALYQQASTQSVPPTNHSRAFRSCGSNTQTGSAELAQIPSDWK